MENRCIKVCVYTCTVTDDTPGGWGVCEFANIVVKNGHRYCKFFQNTQKCSSPIAQINANRQYNIIEEEDEEETEEDNVV